MGKSNTALYFYYHLMISVMVLIITVFILFNHAISKNYVKNFSEGEGRKCLNFERGSSGKVQKIIPQIAE